MAPSSRHILTAVAWPYASGPRHIGHVAGFGVPSDVFSRYHRRRGLLAATAPVGCGPAPGRRIAAATRRTP